MSNLAKTNIINSFLGWLKYNFFIKKFNTVTGWIVMTLLGAGIGIIAVEVDYKIPIYIAIGLAGFIFVIACIYYPEFGFYSTIFFSAFISMPERLFNAGLPMGVAVEMITYVTLISIIAKQYRARANVGEFWRNPATIMFVVLIAYYSMDAFNPEPHSMQGWSNYVRKQISYFVFYYIAFVLFDSFASIKRFFKYWLILAMIIVVYGVKQQWLGLADFEMNWLMVVPLRYELFNQTGFIRKFSIMNDPAAFGVLCASTAIFILILAIRNNNKKKRNRMLVATVLCLMGASYSGTRTCNLMIVAGILAYAIFTLNEKRTYIMLLSFIFFTLFMLFGPFGNNPVVSRIKSTFEGTKDASASLRDFNRHHVQPYLYSHPLGGGIGTCGVEGAIYNPTHYLTDFQPDSGFMKILVEQGWIGLILHLIFYFIFLRQGISGYYNTKNPEVKTWYVALTIYLFTMVVGQYSQIAIAAYPQILFYFPAIVILNKLKKYDTLNPETGDSAKE